MKKIKKPVFKKNQIIVTALAAMIAVAGYLNYAGTSFDSSMLTAGSDSVSESDDSDMTADISAEDIYAQTGEEEETDIASLDEDYEETASADDSVGETVMASSTGGSTVVAEAKVTREQTRSRNKEILMEVINSTNISDSEKQDAIDEMVSMTDAAEKELAAETLLSAQGFEDVVVSISDSGADVVVSSTQVSDAKRAQIEDIVKRSKLPILPLHRCRQQSEFFGEIYNSLEKFTKIVTAPDDRIKDRIYNSPRSQRSLLLLSWAIFSNSLDNSQLFLRLILQKDL